MQLNVVFQSSNKILNAFCFKDPGTALLGGADGGL